MQAKETASRISRLTNKDFSLVNENCHTLDEPLIERMQGGRGQKRTRRIESIKIKDVIVGIYQSQ